MIEQLLRDWHEAGRNHFEKTFKNLDYDKQCHKHAVYKKKYIYLDEGSSGAFILDKETELIYRIKSKYGVPNKRKCLGTLGEVTGEELNRLRWY